MLNLRIILNYHIFYLAESLNCTQHDRGHNVIKIQIYELTVHLVIVLRWILMTQFQSKIMKLA